ncbi:Ornithine/DAP/Arg decarboxylase family and Ornithine decarboxylase family and Alanine racemase/group IV decarboxylase, C-terminal domain and Orn/DAP/Arg decarboxylase 2, C-terminal domain and Orn/DAP/Arg decarboxylase 2, N-terminal domain-containing protein [Strongyloides ratti]|uniref:Ornithine decarboxylase n=1 Tax=Strongyloides ratti TaxID=34506 RepID=A0A090LHA4_STRRB|nr:Ornithine/DAP/Arg decarboxylase family and Ornithine decarboxylase family and Alanine racemase/group IV decarboxylase, C-terminal domain and Orn/DAP/Arg decarboxylase 2, C-terminal domain and Orn/DAP/Arg decarboxylase 2, N-terminal domain-containing protein [Strongyloides ratti]CEF67513.1 Ornithine/DAP/Arg decarboxylase family and Ornithine decarboxylase family and Alanine racemase/group IV decarboxylase, C-terminal domain and Orn/DAP/Arg decarboxylase 2, C-terminal domain and Orn/DAP/Arg decar
MNFKNNNRLEIIDKKPISVFNDRRTSESFARDIANIKNVSGDSRPFYVMDLGRIQDLINFWATNLPRVRPFYAVNCNYDTVLMNILISSPFMGFFANSREMVEKIYEFTNDSSRVFYGNPLLTGNNLNIAVKRNIPYITCYSLNDLKKISLQCPEVKIVLEVNIQNDMPSEDPSAHMGATIEEIPSILAAIYKLNLHLVGFSFSVGQDRQHPMAYRDAFSVIRGLFEMAEDFGLGKMSFINIGSGFSASNILEIRQFKNIADEINASIDDFFPSIEYPDLYFSAKPGKFFAASAFSLLTNIISKDIVDVDAIVHEQFSTSRSAFIYKVNEGCYGSFSCKMNNTIIPKCSPLFDENNSEDEQHFYGSIIGSSDCQSDVIQEICHFRKMNVGEWLIWENMGAYSLSNYEEPFDLNSSETIQPPVFYYVSSDDWQNIISSNKIKNQNSIESLYYESFSNESVVGSIDDVHSITSSEDYEDDDKMEELQELFNIFESVYS